jgi:AGCS family alanine or glycine:cation symporter
MKKIISYFLCLLGVMLGQLPLAHAQQQQPEEQGRSIDQIINESFQPVTDFLNMVIFFEVPVGGGKSVPFVLIWLIVGALFFTVFMRFVNLTGFKHALDVVRGRYDDPSHLRGEVSHFQALTAALSGTVGVGNIAGVAIAVSLGGPGATFWMIFAGVLGMSSKFVECTLGVKYRNVNADGTVSGGPMYYLSKGLAKQGMGGLGKFLAVFFAIACIGGSFGGGNMVQVNQATQQFIEVTGGENSPLYGSGWIFGAVMAIVVALIIIGGIKSIAKVTDKVVPFMVAIYVGGALMVLAANLTAIPSALGQIMAGAFAPEALYGGIVGVLIQGFRRAAFSNEAGVGSASIAHSAARTDEPISEGVVALLEPFIDTVVICTMTALVIIITGYGQFGSDVAFQGAVPGSTQPIGGIAITSSAFAEVLPWFPVVLSFAVILFALSTMISWSYYGLKAWTYLFGETRLSEIAYKVLFCFFVVVGSGVGLQSVFDFGDAMIFAMCFPNVLGLYFLAPEIRKDLASYFNRVKSGEIKRFK